jgi:hypothetical protein
MMTKEKDNNNNEGKNEKEYVWSVLLGSSALLHGWA